MDKQANPHHLILGEINDYLTGMSLPDTLDERYRQKIARILVRENGFDKHDIRQNVSLQVNAGQRKAALKIDFIVNYQDKSIILIKYAPGSLVTRRLSTIALSRIIEPYQIPIAVITNGEDAEIIDGHSGKVTADGLENLPCKEGVQDKISGFSFTPIVKSRFQQASRIAYACEIDGACPCDSDVCVIE